MIPLPIHYTEVEEIYSQTLGSNLSTLAVAAADDSEGVSTLAYALARRAAAMGRKTLLVDFNLRSPSVGQRLGIRSNDWQPGQDSAHDRVVPLSNTGLHVLPASSNNNGWMQARENNTLHECFRKWRQNYDCIIADTSPLTVRNQENFPPENVSAACETTLLVVLTGKTSETRVLEAYNRLLAANAKITGVVMNDRFAPSLADELIRETHRLDGVTKGLMDRVRSAIRNSAFLNQAI